MRQGQKMNARLVLLLEALALAPVAAQALALLVELPLALLGGAVGYCELGLALGGLRVAIPQLDRQLLGLLPGGRCALTGLAELA